MIHTKVMTASARNRDIPKTQRTPCGVVLLLASSSVTLILSPSFSIIFLRKVKEKPFYHKRMVHESRAGAFLAFTERPVDNITGNQRPPDENRLKQKARAMIGPTRGFAANRDIAKRVIDIGRINTQRIKREADPRGITDMRDIPGRDEEPDGACNLCNAGEKNDLLRKRNPARRDRQKAVRALNMGYACDQIDDGKEQPEKPAQIGVFDTPVQRRTCGVQSPHGGGGAGTGWVRSNSTRNRRPSSDSETGGRRSS